jgi:hypothetical protein
VNNSSSGTPVDQLIEDVKEALIQAGFSRASASPVARVASVQLVLELVATRFGGGGVKFCIPFIGTELSLKARRSSRDIHTIDITMVPPDEPAAGLVHGDSMQDALVEALESVREAVRAAAGGSDPWVLSTGTVEICFGITKEGSISIAAEGELAGEVTQTLRLTLAPVAEAASTP